MIFSKKNKRKKTGADTFIGAYLPRSLIESLTLIALSEKVSSKTEILYRFIDEGIYNYFNGCSRKKRCHTIADNAYWLFRYDQSKNANKRQYKNWSSFILQCKEELAKKGLKTDAIREIIDELLSLKKYGTRLS